MAKTPICAVCAQNGSTCCQLTQGDGNLSFPLSRIEKQSITAYDTLKEVRFTVQTANSDQFICRLEFLFPDDLNRSQALFPEHSHHERLLTNSLGHCVFLGPMGCILPAKARPFYCRLFPFWVIRDKVVFFSCDLCQAQKGAGTVNKVITRLETNPAKILLLYNALRRAWEFDE